VASFAGLLPVLAACQFYYLDKYYLLANKSDVTVICHVQVIAKTNHVLRGSVSTVLTATG